MHSPSRNKPLTAVLATAALIGAVAVGGSGSASGADRADLQTTDLISRALDGGVPNGPSTNGVISNDRRWARVIAFESEASDLVRGDANGQKDVFFIRRAGSFVNNGSPWRAGETKLVSRGLGGAPANGPSWAPSVDGSFDSKASCVAFLSAASNLVRGDTNGKVDAFLSRGPGRKLRRVSTPKGKQSTADTTDVQVSGDCSRIAFVTGARLYVRKGKKTRKVRSRGAPADPSWGIGKEHHLVFGDAGGVYLSRGGTARPKLIAPGGSNPSYNDIKRQVVAYEREIGGHVQVAFRDLGRGERIASAYGDRLGNGDSRHPVIGNSGYYISFETEADNLGTNATRRRFDENGQTDAYLYTGVRDITLVQSVEEKGIPLPAGGTRPSMSFYANYILFQSPAPLGSRNRAEQIFMRYLGPV